MDLSRHARKGGFAGAGKQLLRPRTDMFDANDVSALLITLLILCSTAPGYVLLLVVGQLELHDLLPCPSLLAVRGWRQSSRELRS